MEVSTMKRLSQVPFLFLALAIACGTAWALQNGSKLILDGKVISTDVQTIRGRAYVPLNDVAAALERTVARKGGTYHLTRTEGANPIHGAVGQMSADVFSGKWRL